MNYGDDNNPYAPPIQSDFRNGSLDDEMQFPAGRGDRFLARMVDGLLLLAFIIPWAIILSAMDMISFTNLQKNSLEALKLLPAELPVSIYQWILITRSGQTVGKKLMRIRIVKVDGSTLGFGDGVALREWVMRVIGIVPCVGPLISLVGILMIFGDEQRCLHDRIAGTKVVKTLGG